MSADCAAASALTRVFTAARSMRCRSCSSVPPTAPDSGVPSSRMPSSGARSAIVIHSAVAMSVLEGTTSVSTAAPPSPAASTTVTSAPSRRPTRAAS